MTHLPRIFTLSFGSLIILCFSTAIAWESSAQDPPGQMDVYIDLAADFDHPVVVMISAIIDGEIVSQTEHLKKPMTWGVSLKDLAPGLYDIRVEGDGVVTEVKRGIHVFGDTSTKVQVVLQPGEGIHVVEYATGGLAREEVAVRLRALERGLSELKEAQEVLATEVRNKNN